MATTVEDAVSMVGSLVNGGPVGNPASAKLFGEKMLDLHPTLQLYVVKFMLHALRGYSKATMCDRTKVNERNVVGVTLADMVAKLLKKHDPVEFS